MEFTIHANETETVLDALKAFYNKLGNDIETVKKSTETWNVDPIVFRLEQKRETLSRVICRIEDL